MRQRRLKNEINVVPYIDVMLVLLVIFMVTTPLMMTGSVDLPTVGKAQQTPASPIEIIIKADSQLAVREASRKNAERPMSQEEMIKYVKSVQDSEPDRPVVIAGDKNVRYEAVLNVMDALQRAQVKRVGLLVQPKGQ